MRIRSGAIMVALLLGIFMLSQMKSSGALDTITTSQPVRDGDTIISVGGMFQLGFFSPGDPSKRYVGIWFQKVTPVTAVWVANRLMPVTGGKGVLRVTEQGKLILENGTGGVIWSSSSLAARSNPVAQLLDSGNLVVRNGMDGDVLWQSFDYPTDTELAGMKIGINRTSGFNRLLTSWRSFDDPSPGNFTYGVDIGGFPQVILWQGSDIISRSGPWNGVRWSGSTSLGLIYHAAMHKFHWQSSALHMD